MFSFFKKKKKKTISSSVSLEKNGLIFKFELSQEYDDKDNLLEIKTDQIIESLNMLNETILDLEIEEKELLKTKKEKK
jgi:hypothetical protein